MDGSSPRYTEGAAEEPQSPELEKPTVGEDNVEKPQKQSSAEDVKTTKNVKQNSRMKNAGLGKKAESMNGAQSNSCGFKSSTLTKPTLSSASRSSTGVPVARRNSTGGLPDKQPTTVTKRSTTNVNSVVAKKPTSSAPDPVRRSLPEIRRSSLPSANGRSFTRSTISETRKSVPASPAATPKASSSSDTSKYDSAKKSSIKPSSPSTSMRSRESMSFESTGSSGSTRKVVPKLSSLAARSPSVNSGSRTGSLSTSLERSTAFSSHKKTGTTESWDSRLIMLPQVEIKAGDDVRLDLRGHRIRNLNSGGLNLSPTLEFVYLRDNLLSTLDGIEVLKRVKVLDLSFNDFKGPGFEPLENCKALQQLYLAGNQITSLKSLPELPNLEFLSVAQNKLKSLSMACQPRLQVLAASKNKISTLKGFPHLPSLEHLRVEENPILKMSHLEAMSILLVGPTLKKFNDRDLSKEEIALAKRYPAHTALCIRGGWEFCRPDHAVDSTFQFLLEQWKEQLPPGYLLKEAFIDPPFEEDACYCHFNFSKDNTDDSDSEVVLKYQWYIGERTPSNFVAIPTATGEFYWPKHEDIGRILKVECTPILGETEYPTIFAISSPVSRGTGCPKVLRIEVRGDLVEGSIIKGYAEVAWCGGTPGRSVSNWLRKKWNSNPVVIVGAEGDEYQLNLDDIDSCLVFMYTPVTEEGAKGEPQYAITDYIKAAPPSVNDLQFIGDAIEGNIIKGVGKYFGGREGPSKFEWLREDKDTGEFVSVSTGTNEYTLMKEDVGRRLAFVYVPVNFEGQEGKSMSIVSQIIKKAPPKVTNLKIIGELKEGSKITVTGIVTGGTEGSSRVQWFKTCSSSFEGENDLESLSASKIAKAFRIPLGAVGYFLVAKFSPMTPDGDAGEPSYIISERKIETLPPSLNFLSLTGDCIEGGILTASYGYIGGHEGKSVYNWYLHEAENEPGAVISEASGLLQYCLTKDAIGKFVSFKCTPVRDDGTIGESKVCKGQEPVRPGTPRLLSLQIVGTAVEGVTLNVEKKYWGGEEGDSVYRWFRITSDSTRVEIYGATTSSYSLSIDDVGYFISVSCEPVRCDWARGPIVLSEQVGPIIPGPPTCHSLEFVGSLVEGERVGFIASYSGGEMGDCSCEWFRVKTGGVKDKISSSEFLQLTLDDVGECIELIYIPVRKDGLKGSPKSLLSGPVEPGDPMGVELTIPECCEGKEAIPEKRYFGGQEGIGEYIWFRANDKIHGSMLLDAVNSQVDAHICDRTLTYTPSLEDVGAYLALHWLPTRADGKSGKALVSICEFPVSAASPVVSNVHIKELSSSTYLGEGEYFGGYEGLSLYSWYRETNDGTITLIDGANSKTYEVTDEDYNSRLLFGYTPVRSDSVVGELKLSQPTDLILPEIPRIETLALSGKNIEGDVLTAVEVIPQSESQQHVWGKYKKDVRYKWFISSENGSENSFEPLPSQHSCSYKVRFEDIGHSIRCECIVTDVFGRSSEPAYAETASILPGIPRMDKLEIEGRGFHTNLFAFRGIYSGGKEGKSKIQWLRSMVGSPDLISIPGETGRMYEANVDDVGYRLVVIYTPVREDGVEGQPVSASTDPIAVEPDVLKEVKQKLEIGAVKFEVLCDKERSSKKLPGVGSLERRILEVNRKRVKVVKPGSKTSFPTTEIRGTYAPPFHVELFRSDQHRLRIVVDSENEVDLLVQTRHLRDIIALVIRGLAQRFNSTSLNSLLKIET
ncbi:187-kDa microtubule-associated protein AIR9 [Ipomoea triloba]|uniref:187-kDa microtubule-associated protein AIR9 n=1 Tax=Ipomoea triloba TaxID=35885 RepID=UPI00125D23BD|nr:187-kDa microtubule-associated protein AIR9 [Ipomoea triloba]